MLGEEMNLIYRKIDVTNVRDIQQFNELMDELTSHAQDEASLIEKIMRLCSCHDS